MTFFKYNGRSSAEFGLRIEKKDVFSAPEYDMDFESIPGRSGDLIISNNRFKNIRVSYTVFLVRKDIDTLADTLRAIKGWLYTEPDRYHEITDSYDTGYIRYGVIYEGLDIEEQLNKVGCFRVTFSCKPFRYQEVGFEETAVASGESLFNPEAFASAPIITLTGSGDMSLTLQNASYNKTWHFKDIPTAITCDSEQMNFYHGTTLLNGSVVGEDFPKLPPGETIITYTGDVESLVVKPRWCAL